MKAFGQSKPHPREIVSGDAWMVVDKGNSLRAALVDGAGHGEAAASAASIAVKSLQATTSESLTVALAKVHAVLHGTRGAAVSMAEIVGNRLLFAGIGNVEGRLVTPGRERRLSPQRGIAGVVMPKLNAEEMVLPLEEWALLLYSDGISQRLSARWEAVASDPQSFIVDAIAEWGRLTDDATLVVILSSKEGERVHTS